MLLHRRSHNIYQVGRSILQNHNVQHGDSSRPLLSPAIDASRRCCVQCQGPTGFERDPEQLSVELFLICPKGKRSTVLQYRLGA